MKKEMLSTFFEDVPFVLLGLVALWQLGYSAFQGQWVVAIATVVIFALVTYLDDKSSNVSMIAIAVGAMLTTMDTTLQMDIWHVAILIGIGLLAGYHLQLVARSRLELARETKKKIVRMKYKFIIATYVISVCGGMFTLSYMSFSWINVALSLFFALNIYQSYLTYYPKASEFRVVSEKKHEEAT